MDSGEDQVAGQGRLNGDLGGFLIANFADHDFVRVMAQNGTQAAGECQAFFLVDGYLGDAAKLVFDWIFDGDDLVLVGLNFVDGSVQRGSFSGAGGTGDQHHAVWLSNIAAEAAHLFRGKTHDVEA